MFLKYKIKGFLLDNNDNFQKYCIFGEVEKQTIKKNKQK